MTGQYRLRKTTQHLNLKKEDVRTHVPANLGLKIGGQTLVEVPTREGYCYARIRGNLNEVVQVFNTKVSPIYDFPVLISYLNNRWEVEDRDVGRYSLWGSSSPFLGRHGGQHSFDPYNPGGDVTWVWNRQMMPLAAIPSGSSGGPNVVIEPSTYWQNNTWHYAGGTGTADILPSYKPTGSNARMVLVYLDVNGNPQLLGGSTYFSTSLTGTAQVMPYIPAMPNTNAIGIAGIRITSGTSSITWNNIYDLRPWIVGSGYIPTGTISGGGGDTVKISSNDTTSGYLNGKLIEGAGISLTEVNDGGNEALRISSTGTSGTGSGIITGTSSSEFNWYVDGYITTGTNVSAEYVSPRDQTIEKVIFRVKDNGTTGTSIIDINLNDISIFGTGTKPTIQYNDIDNIDVVVPLITSVSQNDVLKLDIDNYAQETHSWFVSVVFTGNIVYANSDNHQIEFTVADDLVISTGTFRVPNRFGRNVNINGVYLNIDSPPLGQSIIADIKQTGTSIFSNPADRPTITAGNYNGYASVPNVSWLSGNYLTADVVQKGSIYAGRDLVITVTAK